MNEATDRAPGEASRFLTEAQSPVGRREWITPEVTKLDLETAQLTVVIPG